MANAAAARRWARRSAAVILIALFRHVIWVVTECATALLGAVVFVGGGS